MIMPDLQRYPWILKSYQKFERKRRKVFDSDNFSIVSLKQEMRKSLLQQETTNENKKLKKQTDI